MVFIRAGQKYHLLTICNEHWICVAWQLQKLKSIVPILPASSWTRRWPLQDWGHSRGSKKFNVVKPPLICASKLSTVYGDRSLIEDDSPDTFSEFSFSISLCSCSVSWFLIGWQCWNIKCRIKFWFKQLDWFGKFCAPCTYDTVTLSWSELQNPIQLHLEKFEGSNRGHNTNFTNISSNWQHSTQSIT